MYWFYYISICIRLLTCMLAFAWIVLISNLFKLVKHNTGWKQAIKKKKVLLKNKFNIHFVTTVKTFPVENC